MCVCGGGVVCVCVEEILRVCVEEGYSKQSGRIRLGLVPSRACDLMVFVFAFWVVCGVCVSFLGRLQ